MCLTFIGLTPGPALHHRFFVYSLLTYRSLAVGDQHMMEWWVLIVKDKDLHLCLRDRLKIGSKLEGPIWLGLIAGGLSNKKSISILLHYFEHAQILGLSIACPKVK